MPKENRTIKIWSTREDRTLKFGPQIWCPRRTEHLESGPQKRTEHPIWCPRKAKRTLKFGPPKRTEHLNFGAKGE